MGGVSRGQFTDSFNFRNNILISAEPSRQFWTLENLGYWLCLCGIGLGFFYALMGGREGKSIK